MLRHFLICGLMFFFAGYAIANNIICFGDNINDNVGTGISVEGDIIAVGAPGYGNGAVFIYHVGDETRQQVIAPNDLADNALFGASVRLHDGLLVVGSENDGSGSVYLYTYNSLNGEFEQKDKITVPGMDIGADFGHCVDIENGIVIIGAPNQGDKGAVYLYSFNGQQSTYIRTIPAPYWVTNGSDFGLGVSVSGGLAVVGIPFHDASGCSNSGAVAIFDINTGSQLQKLECPDASGSPLPVSSDNYGISVSIDDDVLVVGANRKSYCTTWSGAAFVYRYNSGAWNWEKTLSSADNVSNVVSDDLFGWPVLVEDGFIAVGSVLDERYCDRIEMVYNMGSVFLYSVSDTSISYIANYDSGSDGMPNEYYGNAVGIADNLIVIGAPYSASSFPPHGQGAAYIYDISETVLIGDLDGNGLVEIEDLRLMAGVWLSSDSIADIAPGGGDGIVDMLDLAKMGQAWGGQ